MRTGILGGPSTLEDHQAAERAAIEEQIREARLSIARRNSRWAEIEDDFVRRGHKGHLLVSASSDHVYTLVRGVIFQPGSAAVVADYTSLWFTVDEAGVLTFYERQPGTWSEHVAKQAERERRRGAPRPARGGRR